MTEVKHKSPEELGGSAPPVDRVRVDIQWMRALAVGLVLLYHFWPTQVRGGFVGVDVFFVISGFLITSHLLAKPPTHPRDLVAFWGRRIRRLLPAAFTVIILTVVAVLVFAPITQWYANAWSALYSGLYVENWNLAWTATDYLAADIPATAVQHYWSLSVEEQFYLVWPVLILGIALLVRRKWESFRVAAGVGIGMIVILSLGWSIYFTRVDPAQAYFVTPTRMWELAAGGALAAGYPVIARKLAAHPYVKLSLVTIGVTMMTWSGFFLTGKAFPGWIAVIPILGAVVVIGAGPGEHRWSFDTILRWRPIQLLGDMSYSVYLWHWPFVVIVPWVLGYEMSLVIKLGVIAVILILSWLSKTFIEDRFRGLRPLGQPIRRTFVFLVVGMAVTVGVSWVAIGLAQAIGRVDEPIEIPSSAGCVGAAARLDPACLSEDPHGSVLYITPMQAMRDSSVAYRDYCWWSEYAPDNFPVCEYGSTDPSAPQIALFGNSHAGPYLNPLIALAQEQDWGLRTYLAARCVPSTRPLDFQNDKAQEGCVEFTARSIAAMKEHGTQLVLVTAYPKPVPLAGVSEDNQDEVYSMMNAELLAELVDNGMNVLVIRDTPRPESFAVDCVARHLHNVSACDGLRSDWLYPDPLFEAAVNTADPRITALDFTDALCDEQTCAVVVGGIIVYFDHHHLTSTFAHTLRPYYEPAILDAVNEVQ